MARSHLARFFYLFCRLATLALCATGCGGGGNNADTSTRLPSNESDSAAKSGKASGISVDVAGAESDAGSLHEGDVVHVYITAAGQNLFTAGGAGCLHDPYTPGVFEQDVTAGPLGSLSFSFAFSDMASAVDASCEMNASARLEQFDRLQIQLSIPADVQRCGTLCGTQSPASNVDCLSDCIEGSRKIVAAASYNHEQLTQLDLASRNGVALINWRAAFNSLGIPISQTGNLPDLIVDGFAAANSWRVSAESFVSTDCAVVEGCVTAGSRKLLRFDGSFVNAGTGDFVLGAPESNPNFVFSACHNHYHLNGIMLYQLLLPGTLVPVASASGRAVSRKQGFCVEDINQAAGFKPGKYTCESQGLTSGWEDTYDGALDCQWIDVTDVPRGDYILRITVNPEGLFQEADTTNNNAEVPIQLD